MKARGVIFLLALSCASIASADDATFGRYQCAGMAPVPADKLANCQPDDYPEPKVCRNLAADKGANDEWAKWNKENPDKSPMPHVEVTTLIIPHQMNTDPDNVWDRGRKVVGDTVVQLFIDPATKRIVSYTAEPQSPPGVAAGEPSRYWDPRLPLPGVDDDVQGKSLAKKAHDFDVTLDAYLKQAKALQCPFAKEHADALTYSSDPFQRDVDAFFKGCDDAAFPCCADGQAELAAECPNGAIGEGETVSSMKAISRVINASNGEFNRDLLHRLRSGLVTTQYALLASTDGNAPGFKDFKMGATKASSACGADRNKALDGEIAKHDADLGSAAAPEVRKKLEWADTKKTVIDTLRARYAQCDYDDAAFWGGSVATGDSDHPLAPRRDLAEARLNEVLDQNRTLGVIDESDRDELFDSVKEGLKGAGVGADINFDALAKRGLCGYPQARAELDKAIKLVAAIKPSSPGAAALLDSKGILGAVRGAKRKALASLRKSLDKMTAKCAKADEMYKDGVFSDDGLKLWADRPLLSSLVRDYAKQGRDTELRRFKYLYCKNKKELETSQKHKRIGLLVAAVVLAPVPVIGEYAEAGAITAIAGGVMTAEAYVGLGLAYGNYVQKKEEAERARASYLSNFGDYSAMSEADKDYYWSIGGLALAGGVSLAQTVSYAKYIRASLAAERALTSSEAALFRKLAKATEDDPGLRKLVGQAFQNASCAKGDCSAVIKRFEELSAEYERGAAGIKTAAAHVWAPPQIVKRKDGITGGHNMDEFEAKLSGQGQVVSKKPVPGVPGAYRIEYRLYGGNADGTISAKLNQTLHEKTVFDPKIWSQDKIADLAEKVFGSMPRSDGQYKVIYNGVEYIGWYRNGVLQSFGIE